MAGSTARASGRSTEPGCGKIRGMDRGSIESKLLRAPRLPDARLSCRAGSAGSFRILAPG